MKTPASTITHLIGHHPPGPVNDQRDTVGSGVRSTLSAQLAVAPRMAAEPVTVVRRVEHDRVVELALPFEAVEQPPDWTLQGTRGTIVVRGKKLTVYRNTPATPGDPTRYSTMTSRDEQVTEETVDGAVYGDQNEIYAEAARALTGEQPRLRPGDLGDEAAPPPASVDVP